MTFLELCQELCDKANIPKDQLTSVTGTTGELSNVVTWAKDAWIDIQTMQDGKWKYLHTEFLATTRAKKNLDAAAAVDNSDGTVTIPITAHGFSANDLVFIHGTDNYDGTYAVTVPDANNITITVTYVAETFSATDIAFVRDYDFRGASSIKSFDLDSLYYYLKTDGSFEDKSLSYVEYKEFQRKNRDYSVSNAPSSITITPSDRLRVYPAPDAAYAITGDAFKVPQVLTNDTDVPLMPSEYHMAIVWKALVDYAGFEESSPVITFASAKWEDFYNKLLWQQKYESEQYVVRPQ